MIGLSILIVITAYELYRLWKMDEFFDLEFMLRSIKGKKPGDEVYDNIANHLMKYKRYPFYIACEGLYCIAIAVLFFVGYWQITVALLLLSSVRYVIKKKENKIYINYLDCVITIVVLLIGMTIL